MRTGLSLVLVALLTPALAAQNPVPKYEGKPLEYWLERFQKAETETDRESAEKALCAFGADATPALPVFLEMLNDRSESYRTRIEHILCNMGADAKSAVPELAKRLEKKIAISRRQRNGDAISECLQLMRILGSIGEETEPAIPALKLALSESDLAREAISTLCSIGPAASEAIPAIRKAVFDDSAIEKNRDQRYVTISSVCPEFDGTRIYFPTYKINRLGRDALPLLLDLADVYIANHYALSQIGELGPEAKKARPKLTSMLQDKNPKIRRNAAFALCSIDRTEDAIPVLVELTEDDDPSIVQNAVWHLGEMGPKAKTALKALEKAKSWSRDQIPNLLYFSGGLSVVPYTTRVQLAAEEAIRKISEPAEKK